MAAAATPIQVDIRTAEEFRQRLLKWYKDHGRAFPWRSTSDPFKIIVAEVLLKLTGAWKAEKAYRQIVAHYGTVRDMAMADASQLRPHFHGLGLVGRADTLVQIAKSISTEFGGQVPEDFDELVSIKGVGTYIANAVLCLAFGKSVPLVDGSVRRVFCRCLGYASGKPAYADKELWGHAHRMLPDGNVREYNLALLDLGALVCTHHKPAHEVCPIRSLCLSMTGKERGDS